jgi:hypothetical protein
MYANENFDVSEVSVEVSNGVVTLDGTVDDRYSKYMLEEMVDSIPGVKDVDNRLRIQRGSESRTEGTSDTSSSGTSGTSSGSTRSSGRRGSSSE